jgi:cell division protease FtsH
MAGRLGEELETNDFSNGAASDIKQATKIARHMVCDWGMSDLGPVALGDNQEQVFLAKEITRTQNYSEATAQRIDGAIREIIQSQYERACAIIEEKREALKTIAEALLAYETIEGKHVYEILQYGEIRSAVESIKDRADSQDEDAEDDADAKKPAAEEDEDDKGLSPETAPAPA